MKKILFFGLLAMAVLTFGFTSIAGAEATVVDEFGCSLLATDSGLLINLFTDDVTHAVVTPSGNSILQCHFDIPEGFEPDRTMKNNGFLCGTFLGLTTDSQSIANKGGKAHLTCIINPSDG